MLEELKTFIAVVEEKSFTKAAEKVNLSQPSVSVHIKHLESYFNTLLITRSMKPKKIMITESGHLLYKRSKQLLSLLDTTKEELHHINSSFKGHLKIGATSTIGEYLLPSFLADFCNHYQDINIEVSIGNTAEITSKMKTLQLDVALVEGVLSIPSFKQKCFFEDQLVLIAPSSYLFNEDLLASHLLHKQRWLTREHGSGLREALDAFLVAHQIIPKSKLVLSSNYAIKEAVKNGLGIAMIPKSMIKQLGSLTTIQVLQLNTSYKIAFSSLLPKDLPTSPIADLFLESFVQYINTEYKHIIRNS